MLHCRLPTSCILKLVLLVVFLTTSPSYVSSTVPMVWLSCLLVGEQPRHGQDLSREFKLKLSRKQKKKGEVLSFRKPFDQNVKCTNYFCHFENNYHAPPWIFVGCLKINFFPSHRACQKL